MSDSGDGLVGPTRQLRQIPVLKTSCCARYIWRLCPESVAWSRLLSLYRNDSKLNRKVHSWLLLWAKIPTETSLYWIGDIIHDISISRNRTFLGWPFVYSRRLHRFDGPRLQKQRWLSGQVYRSNDLITGARLTAANAHCILDKAGTVMDARYLLTSWPTVPVSQRYNQLYDVVLLTRDRWAPQIAPEHQAKRISKSKIFTFNRFETFVVCGLINFAHCLVRHRLYWSLWMVSRDKNQSSSIRRLL